MNEQTSFAGSTAWSWRHAITQSGLPSNTRWVLMALSLHMNEMGGSCFPSIAQIVSETGLDKKTVLKHLALAKEEGWIRVENVGFRGQRWKRASYIAAWPERKIAGHIIDGSDDGSDEESHEGGGAVPPPSGNKVVEPSPEGGGVVPPKAVEQLHQDKSIPRNIPDNISREREARERDDFSDRDGETTANAEADETPKALERRFRALELGSGGKSIAWPGAAGSSSAWGLKQFVALSPEDRRKAEEMRDAYLAICPKVERGPHKGEPKPVALGVYLRDRKFLFAEAMAPKAETARRTERAAPWGPAWGAKRMALLLEGPAELPARGDLRGLFEARFAFFNKTDRAAALRFAEHRGVAVTADGFVYPDDFEDQELARRTVSGFPMVNALHRAARDRRYEAIEPVYDGLSELMEPVPVGGDMWNRWEDWHADRNLPFVPETGDQRVVFFPKGGPNGLAAFKRAVDAATTTEAAE
ncbi:MAG: helix-turn-helix domain-containing protein [Martelella sp.]|uniref:helix-turn-helix domain-containing protein n=1 Tax=Martelella sp. TaxID=1969699 RepID=UPI003242336B